MAWHTAAVVMLMLTNIILINSQDEMTTAGGGAAGSRSVWTWMMSSTEAPRTNDDGTTALTDNIIITEAPRTNDDDAAGGGTTVTPAGEDGQQTPVTAIVEDKEATAAANEDATSQALWTADNVSSGQPASGSTTPRFQLVLEVSFGKDACSLYNIVVMGVLNIVISVFGLVGNSICVVVFWPDRNKSASRLLLLQLAVIDSCVLVTWSVQLTTYALVFNLEDPGHGLLNTYPYLFKYGWSLANGFQIVSIWLIVIITLQRYVAVCHPHKMRVFSSVKLAWVQLAVLLVVSMGFCIPRNFEVDIVTLEDGTAGMVDTEMVDSHAYLLYYKGIAYYTVVFVAPISFLFFFTVSLIRELRKSKMKVKVDPKGSQPAGTGPTTATGSATNTTTAAVPKKPAVKPQSGRDDITFALVVVDVVFICCQLFVPSRRVADLFITPADRECGQPFAYYHSLSGVGVFINSSVNFVIFCLCGKGFRAQVKQRLCGRNTSVNPGPSTLVTAADK